MLVMPIIVRRSKDSNVNKIYNVKVSLNSEHASKVKEDTILKGIESSDILLNGVTYKDDPKYIKDDISSITSFIRDNNYKFNTPHFLVTTSNNDSNTYDVYKVSNLPRKVTAGLDNLYSMAIKDMMEENQSYQNPTYIDLKKLGIDNNMTEEKLETLRAIMSSNNPLERKEHIMQINGVSSLYKTISYIRNFDFKVINYVYEDDIKNVIDSFEEIGNKNYSLNEYYDIACNNKDVYKKLNKISKVVDQKPLAIIKNSSNPKVLQKRSEDNVG